ncbi:atypical membrane-integrating protein (Mistic protein) [Rossellomorea sp. BNER]|uniref:atypical membrane-integrating protein (Mistic protein) n=1 Tax=Rossellomorea sp. BNER TaxID=2962031 RepID=UPI003AF2F5AE|nr:atypical membrane-integrating protein (Mistic protein) [Rossellomorea sp. BNER]
MRAKKTENETLSKAIDNMQEGLDSVIELYNELEDDKPLISFDKEVLEDLEKAKHIYGEEYVSQKLNTIVKEVLTWLDLEYEEEDDEEED